MPLTHVVLMKLAPAGDADHLAALLNDLNGKIPGLQSLSAGRNVVPSERAFDLGLVAVFDDHDALQEYQSHPAHVAVAGGIRAAAEQIVAVDFDS